MPVNPLAERHLLPAVEQPHRLLDALVKPPIAIASLFLCLRVNEFRGGGFDDADGASECVRAAKNGEEADQLRDAELHNAVGGAATLGELPVEHVLKRNGIELQARIAPLQGFSNLPYSRFQELHGPVLDRLVVRAPLGEGEAEVQGVPRPPGDVQLAGELLGQDVLQAVIERRVWLR